MRIYKDFRFEAAHYLPNETASANSRIHGHSFRARVTIDGRIDPETGYVFHFDESGAGHRRGARRRSTTAS